MTMPISDIRKLNGFSNHLKHKIEDITGRKSEIYTTVKSVENKDQCTVAKIRVISKNNNNTCDTLQSNITESRHKDSCDTSISVHTVNNAIDEINHYYGVTANNVTPRMSGVITLTVEV